MLADRAGEAAGVNTAHSDAAPCGQPCGQVLLHPPIGGLCWIPFHNHPCRDWIGGLVILGGDACVANMREGEGYDLPSIGGVGHNLLIARHRGVEAQLGNGLACGAKTLAVEHGSISQNKTCSGAFSHGAAPITAMLKSAAT